jgi:hypothetical protein
LADSFGDMKNGVLEDKNLRIILTGDDAIGAHKHTIPHKIAAPKGTKAAISAWTTKHSTLL